MKKEFKIDMHRRPGKTYLTNKMKQEFNLSEKIWSDESMDVICKEDVKEAVKRLKMTILITPSPMEKGEFIMWLEKEINKIFGDKLSK